MVLTFYYDVFRVEEAKVGKSVRFENYLQEYKLVTVGYESNLIDF